MMQKQGNTKMAKYVVGMVVVTAAFLVILATIIQTAIAINGGI